MRIVKYLPGIVILALLMPIAFASTRELGKYLGLVRLPVPVVGTGSMYPSLYWEEGEGGPYNAEVSVIPEYRTTPLMYHKFAGFTLAGRQFLVHQLERGDMVAFASSTTVDILAKEGKDTSSGFIKRIVGLPGDTIELRDGYVIVNGETISEPYIYRPRSTYGEEFLADCQKLEVPPGQLFVMGDNRKASLDSRAELGLIASDDVTFFLPYEEQAIYQSLWRDTSRDAELAGTASLDAKEFYTLLSSKRQEQNLKKLVPSALLAKSSSLQARQNLLGNDQYGLKESMAEAGYSNIVTATFSTRGRYNAEELLQNLLSFSETSGEILDPRYTEIGVSAVNLVVNVCPAELVVGHLGGYIPAEYDPDVVDNWKSLVVNLESVIPSWEKAREYQGIDQGKLEELLTIYNRRLTLAREVVNTMEKRDWLSSSLEERINIDEQDAASSEILAKELNGN